MQLPLPVKVPRAMSPGRGLDSVETPRDKSNCGEASASNSPKLYKRDADAATGWASEKSNITTSSMKSLAGQNELRMRWQNIQDKFFMKPHLKDEACKDGLIQEAMVALDDWAAQAEGDSCIEMVFYTLTALFSGKQERGDKNVFKRRDRAIAEGWIERVLTIATLQFNAKYLHCMFANLSVLLSGDDPGSNARRVAALTATGKDGNLNLSSTARSVLASYPEHGGVTACAKAVQTQLAMVAA